MKRFLAFQYDRHYPAGGLSDFVGDFDSLDEALAACEKVSRNEPTGEFADILDYETGERFDGFTGKPQKLERLVNQECEQRADPGNGAAHWSDAYMKGVSEEPTR